MLSIPNQLGHHLQTFKDFRSNFVLVQVSGELVDFPLATYSLFDTSARRSLRLGHIYGRDYTIATPLGFPELYQEFFSK